MKREIFEKYLICPKCGASLSSEICGYCGAKYGLIDEDILDLFEKNESNEMSQQKWEEVFQDEFFQKKAEEEFREVFLKDTLRQILESSSKKTGVYMEVGCGQGYIGEELARMGWFFIGVDYSKTALLQLKKRLLKNGLSNFLLVRADINELPIKDNCVDLIYGGGVIEHLEDTQRVVNHLHRVLKPGGVTFNTVPFFNIGNLVYRSAWGSIPNVPVLKQIAEFVNIKLLKAKHMVFGYELQFTEKQLSNLHIKAGFSPEKVSVGRFECYIQIHKLKNHKKIQEYFRNLCKTNKNFWPMVKVIAQKQ